MVDLPTAIWSGTFTLFGVVLHCHVLDDGRRLIEAPDMYRLMVAMGTGQDVPIGDLQEFAAWQHGKS